MQLLFCFDKNYQQHFGVALTSVLLNNLDNHFDVHIITDFIEDQLKQKLEKLSKNYKCSFYFYTIEDLDKFSKLKVSGHISKAAYYRLIMADLLPDNINKVLYLDSDLVVTSSLEELYNIEINNYFLAAAGFGANLEISQKKTFNSGVMLINLEKWRNENISKKVIDFAIKNKEKLAFWDQTALNRVIKGNYLKIEGKWNFQADLSPRKIKNPDDNIDIENAKIVHYVGASKPWYFWVSDKRKNIYKLYLNKSLWSMSKFKMIFKQIGYFQKVLQKKLRKKF